MNGSFLASLAEGQTNGSSRQSLLVRLASRIDSTNLVPILVSGCRPLQHLAWQRFGRLSPTRIARLIEPHLISNSSETRFLMKALAHDSIPLSTTILDQVISLLESPLPELRQSTATLLADRSPATVQACLEQRGASLDFEVLRQFCRADATELTRLLMTAFGYPEKQPPPTIGFAVNSVWLSDHFHEDSSGAEWLIRQCGYFEGDVTDSVLDLLGTGFSFVSPEMVSPFPSSETIVKWLDRVRSFLWRLLPSDLELQSRDVRPLDVDDPVDTGLFLAAVRDSDRMRFTEQKSLPPFDWKTPLSEAVPVCFHASARYVRRLFLDQPCEWAEQWRIPHGQRGDFLIEAARVQLETHTESRIAMDRALRGRWQRYRSAGCLPGTTDWSPRHLVLGRNQSVIVDERLSPGANSVVALAAACGHDWKEVSRWLIDAEQHWSRWMLPIGIEVQIPRVDPDKFAAWKEALPWLGIPSPIRPELGGTVEAAFRPARSFHAPVLGLRLLTQWGVISKPQDMALHLSLQAEFGEAVRWLAFPQFFIHPSQRLRNRPDWTMTRVMSKGFVHVHEDAEIIDPAHPTPQRTELRLYRAFAEEMTGRLQLSPTAGSDIIATAILASMMNAPCLECRRLFEEHARAVEQAAGELPSAFQELLAANYYESTGEPRDATLLSLLPIFQQWSHVRQIVRNEGWAELLDQRFCLLRNRTIEAFLNHGQNEHPLPTSELLRIDDEWILEFPI